MAAPLYPRSIPIPSEHLDAFRNLHRAKKFAIDIGGSLAKLAYYSEVSRKRTRTWPGTVSPRQHEPGIYEVRECDETGAKLDFIKFETKYIESWLNFVGSHLLSEGETMRSVMKATGGGAHKYTQLLTEKFGVRVDKEDEMQCLIKGCNFLLKNIPNESFIFQRDATPQCCFQNLGPDIFPYLLVNIGSGVSVVKVDSENEFKRIGGTSMGGGTFWGLGSLITEAKGFDELLQLAASGNHKNVDMLVGDIYGGAYELLGLPSDLIASSFGKAARSSKDPKSCGTFGDADKAKSLLHMISNDIGQIAYLNARLHNLKRIYFGGYFIRGHPVTMHTITFAINYWSKGEVQALFLRHEGYLGAVGAFLKGAEEENIPLGSWSENLAGSSRFGDASRRPQSPVSYDVLELDHCDNSLEAFPFLADVAAYKPDLINLSEESDARHYWLHCFEEMVDKVADCAAASHTNSLDAKQRAETFKEKHRGQLAVLSGEPSAYGPLTVRNLLNARQQCLVECLFPDPYAMVKKIENERALGSFLERIQSLDALPWEEKQMNLIEGILTGNVFDWGAKEVTKLFEEGELAFEAAKAKLQTRPWLIDSFDDWMKRLQGPPHNCAIIFTDNSGNDIILGIFPLVRELLNRGTKVILAANSLPCLNDVVASELNILLSAVAEMCPILKAAQERGDVMVLETGSDSPCLDLRRVDCFLAEACVKYKVDFILLEGMGRAIHTNFNALFTCECLKLAVLKNNWLSRRLGGHTFDVVFKYERPQQAQRDA